MNKFKEVNEKEMKMVNGGKVSWGKCVWGAYGAAAAGAFTTPGGPLTKAGGALAAEIAYMGANGCFG